MFSSNAAFTRGPCAAVALELMACGGVGRVEEIAVVTLGAQYADFHGMCPESVVRIGQPPISAAATWTKRILATVIDGKIIA
jgi:hypothetical protein